MMSTCLKPWLSMIESTLLCVSSHQRIYGFEQAPHAWYNERHRLLLDQGFTNFHDDTSLCIIVMAVECL